MGKTSLEENKIEGMKKVKEVKEGEYTSVKDICFDMATELIVERKLNGNRMGISDELTNTNLISKHYSPLIVRKLNIMNGWPLYVGMICDEDLSDLDNVVNGVFIACRDAGMLSNSIQNMRNFTGILSETLQNYYNSKKENCVEGVAILLYVDKCAIENFFGDFMNHTSCRIEWGAILSMLPHI